MTATPKTVPVQPLVRNTSSRGRLFEAAMVLVGEFGPDKVTVDEIAAAAGVAKGTVYYQFGSKNDLITALIDHGYGTMRKLLTDAASVEDPLEAIRTMTVNCIDFLVTHEGYAELWISEMWRAQSPWCQQLRRMRQEVLEILVHVLERIPGRREDVDTMMYAVSLLGATYVAGMDAIAREAHLSPEGRAADRERRIEALLAGLHGYIRD